MTARSLRFGTKRIADYDDRRATLLAGIEGRNGRQPGDPARLAEAIVSLSRTEKPPMRFLAGSVALGAVDQKLSDMRTEFDRWRQLSVSTDGAFGDNASLAGFAAQIDRT